MGEDDGDDGDEGDGERTAGDRPGAEIAPLGAVPRDSTYLFTVRDVHADTEVEAILVRTDGGTGEGRGGGESKGGDAGDRGGGRTDGGSADADAPDSTAEVEAWLNYCKHWTDVRLDKGSGAPRRDGQIVCGRHGATFEADTGHCDFGPCEGAYLDAVEVTVADGAVYLADPDYEFRHEGAAEDDDLDLSTNPGGRLGF